MTFVIITAGIDLSVGAVLVFSGVISANVMERIGGDNWGVILVGLVAALVAGLAWGMLNGVLVTKARVPALIVTLGTLGMALGRRAADHQRRRRARRAVQADRHDRHGRAVRADPVAGDHRRGGRDRLRRRARGHPLRPLHVRDRVQRRRRRAARASRSTGTSSRSTGSRACWPGLAGCLSLARFSTTTIGGHATDNLQAIAAVVLGGTSLFGGHRDDRRDRRRRVHPGRAAERVRDHRRAAVLAAGRGGRGADPRGLPRPAPAARAVSELTTGGGEGRCASGQPRFRWCASRWSCGCGGDDESSSDESSASGGGGKNYSMTLDRRRQGRRVLHHDELRGPGGGEGRGRQDRLPGPGPVRRRRSRRRSSTRSPRRSPTRCWSPRPTPRRCYAPIKQLADGGSKVVLVDTTLEKPDMAVSQIASDNLEGGARGRPTRCPS